MEKIKITTNFINLGQLLKLIGLIANGAEAKVFLLNNDVFVDYVKENRRGRKIYNEMVVQINNIEYQVISEGENE